MPRSARGLPPFLLLVFSALLPGCAHNAPPPVLRAFGMAMIDGVKDASDQWQPTGCASVTLNLPAGKTLPAEFCAMNDVHSVYFSIDYARGFRDSDAYLAVTTDSNPNPSQLKDQVVGQFTSTPNPFGTMFFGDAFLSAAGMIWPSVLDKTAGGSDNGSAAYNSRTGRNVIEIRHPLANTADPTRDLGFSAGDTIDLEASTAVEWVWTHLPGMKMQVLGGGSPSSDSKVGGLCKLLSFQAEECRGPYLMQPGFIYVVCLPYPCTVMDPLPENCLVKMQCPPCRPGHLCPLFYRLHLTGLGDAWDLDLIDMQGRRVEHQRVAVEDGLILGFRPPGEAVRDGGLPDWALVFRLRPEGEAGRVYRIGTRLEVTDEPFDQLRR